MLWLDFITSRSGWIILICHILVGFWESIQFAAIAFLVFSLIDIYYSMIDVLAFIISFVIAVATSTLFELIKNLLDRHQFILDERDNE